MLSEHSIFPLLPLISKYFPSAEIIPAMLKAYVTEEQAEEFAKKLISIATDKTLVIASVDFSHGATSLEVRKHDTESIKTIAAFDMDKIYSLELDSQPAIFSLLSYLKSSNATQPIFMGNANASSFVRHADPDNLTSYVTFYFQENPIDLAEVFAGKSPDLSKYNQEELVTILATGDVMLGRAVNLRMRRTADYAYPFRKTGELLRQADITFINFESAIVPNPTLTNEGFQISASEKCVKGLKFAGIDVVNLSNNHVFDYGSQGKEFTEQVLSENGIDFCDFSKTAILEVKGSKFAFLGFNFLDPQLGVSYAKSKIIKAAAVCDVVVVALHFGQEYTYYPYYQQRKLARSLIDAGADLVVGNHPHYVQGVERYKDKFITYSHGNFIFDQVWSAETQEGVVGKYAFYKGNLVGVSFVPIEIKNMCQPVLADKPKSMAILKLIEDSSDWIRRASN